jgi:hypothetical protein
VGGAGLAVMDKPDAGPKFGADGLYIPLQGTKATRCKLGSYYAKLPNGGRSLFHPSEGLKTTLTSLKAGAINALQLEFNLLSCFFLNCLF